MTTLAFVGALSLSVLIFELLSGLRAPVGGDRLSVHVAGEGLATPPSTWQALLIALWPRRFDPLQARTLPDVLNGLRRAGYPYRTTGEFYLAAMRDFTFYLVIGLLLAGLMAMLGAGALAAVIALPFLGVGLRRPYSRLRRQVRERAEACRANLLLGLAAFHTFVQAGIGVQEALRQTAALGGPFCNLLGFLAARMEVEPLTEALAATERHLPDPDDLELRLFFQDLRDHFERSRPLEPSVAALLEAVRRQAVERVEARAAVVKRQAGLWGVLAVMGLLVALILPVFAGGL